MDDKERLDWAILLKKQLDNFIREHDRFPLFLKLGEIPLKALYTNGAFEFSNPDELKNEGIYGYLSNIPIKHDPTLSKEYVSIE